MKLLYFLQKEVKKNLFEKKHNKYISTIFQQISKLLEDSVDDFYEADRLKSIDYIVKTFDSRHLFP